MMTLQDLLDELSSLPISARTAPVDVTTDVNDFAITAVIYEHGVVSLICDEIDTEEAKDDTD